MLLSYKKIEEELKTEKEQHKQTKQKLNNHVCSGTVNPGSPTDTENDSDNNQTKEKEVKIIREDNEQQITQQINKELNLGLDNPSLNQVITEVKELIHKPPTSFAISTPSNQALKNQLHKTQQTIVKLEKELQEKQTPFGEKLEVIKELELNSLQELFNQAVDSAVIQEIQQATSYQQVVAARQAFLQKHLGEKQDAVAAPLHLQTIQQDKTQQLIKQRNLGLVAAGTTLMTGIVITSILGRKVKELKRENRNYYEDYKQLKEELSELLIKMRSLVREEK